MQLTSIAIQNVLLWVQTSSDVLCCGYIQLLARVPSGWRQKHFLVSGLHWNAEKLPSLSHSIQSCTAFTSAQVWPGSQSDRKLKNSYIYIYIYIYTAVAIDYGAGKVHVLTIWPRSSTLSKYQWCWQATAA